MRRAGLALLVGCALAGCGRRASPGADSLRGKRVVMVVAHQDFRDEELREPKAVLEARGAAVTVASSALAPAHGMLGMTVTPGASLDDLDAGDYDAVVFVGGVGAAEYWSDLRARALAKQAVEGGQLLAAISQGTVILVRAGVLKLKRVTAWPTEIGTLRRRGGIYTGADVQVDDRLITANGPQAARAFGEALADVLAQPIPQR